MHFNDIQVGQAFWMDISYHDHIAVKLNDNCEGNAIVIRAGNYVNRNSTPVGTLMNFAPVEGYQLVDIKFFVSNCTQKEI